MGDQNLSYYKTTLRTLKWQKRIFLHFFQVCAVQSHIIYKQCYGHQPDDHTKTLLGFLDLLIDDLVAEEAAPEVQEEENKVACDVDIQPERVQRSYKRLRTLEGDVGRYGGGTHCPVRLGSNNTRGRCRICKKKSYYVCDTCGVTLCVQKDLQLTCFKKFHTEVHLVSEDSSSA